MNITTKFNTGDKVWYYIPEVNRYAWGKVISLDISVRLGSVDAILYNVENRFHKYREFMTYCRDWRSEYFIRLSEKETFENVDELKDYLNKTHNHQMEQLSEAKKSLWGNSY